MRPPHSLGGVDAGGSEAAAAQGENAGHWRGLKAGAAQRECDRCGMKMSAPPPPPPPPFIKSFGS